MAASVAKLSHRKISTLYFLVFLLVTFSASLVSSESSDSLTVCAAVVGPGSSLVEVGVIPPDVKHSKIDRRLNAWLANS